MKKSLTALLLALGILSIGATAAFAGNSDTPAPTNPAPITDNDNGCYGGGCGGGNGSCGNGSCSNGNGCGGGCRR